MAEKPKPTTFTMVDAKDVKTTKGTSFLIYGPSGSRKTRTLGTMPSGSFTLHISLDSGSSSATDAAEAIGIEGADHKVATPTSLKELNDIIIALHTHPAYQGKIDNIIIDNLIVIASWVQSYVSASPRYEKDALHIKDAYAEDTSKNAAGSKLMPYFGDVQRVTRELILQLLQLTDSYNLFLLAGEVDGTDKDGSPMVKVLVNGPKSIDPIVSMFSEVYRTSFKEGEFDTKDSIVTNFKISTYTDPLTGVKFFGKTRNIKDMVALKANTIPADFRVILGEQIGYVNKADRPKPEPTK